MLVRQGDSTRTPWDWSSNGSIRPSCSLRTLRLRMMNRLSGTRDPELYWLVDDAEAALQELKKGVEVAVPLKQMPFGKVFGVKNTTGRTCFILALAKDRPSKPVYGRQFLVHRRSET